MSKVIIGVRRRVVGERCCVCEAEAGTPCVELAKWLFSGERKPVRNASSWHCVDILSEVAS